MEEGAESIPERQRRNPVGFFNSLLVLGADGGNKITP